MSQRFLKFPIAFAIISYCAAFIVSLPCNSFIWSKYFSTPVRAFDHDNYLRIAEFGYRVPSEPAFYPLWPIVISPLRRWLSPDLFIVSSNLISLGMFFVSINLMWALAQKLTNKNAALWTIFLYAINPNSIFHAIGYSESLFCVLALWFLSQTLKFWYLPDYNSAGWLVLSAALMSASRPIMLPLLVAGILGFIVMHLGPSHKVRATRESRVWALWLIITGLGTAMGYLPFGIYCWGKFNNFFQPFAAQSYWNRTFGWHWSLITNPKSVSSSDNILTWDIQAFYLPILLSILSICYFWRYPTPVPSKKPSDTEVSNNHNAIFLILICIFTAAAHSAIAFFTYPIFMSLGRHVMATPFFFLAAVAIVSRLTSERTQGRIFGFYLFGSLVYLVNFWTRFGNSAWMG